MECWQWHQAAAADARRTARALSRRAMADDETDDETGGGAAAAAAAAAVVTWAGRTDHSAALWRVRGADMSVASSVAVLTTIVPSLPSCPHALRTTGEQCGRAHDRLRWLDARGRER